MPVAPLLFAVVASVLAACGRIGFDDPSPAGGDAGLDGRSDAGLAVCPGSSTLVYDEDGDLIGNPCDVCPHVADPGQADGDGDRVGDACDPEPAVGRQRIVFFDGFDGAVEGWAFPVAIAGGQLVLDGLSGSVVSRPTGAGVLETAGWVDPIVPSSLIRKQLVVGTRTSPTLFYYVELISQGAGRRRSLMREDQTIYTEFDGQAEAAAPMSPGPIHVRFETGADGFAATVDYGGSAPRHAVAGLRPIAGAGTLLYAEGMLVHLDYVVQIDTL